MNRSPRTGLGLMELAHLCEVKKSGKKFSGWTIGGKARVNLASRSGPNRIGSFQVLRLFRSNLTESIPLKWLGKSQVR